MHFAIGLLNKYDKFSIDTIGFGEGIYNEPELKCVFLNCFIISMESYLSLKIVV